jgi:hypothetical protein
MFRNNFKKIIDMNDRLEAWVDKQNLYLFMAGCFILSLIFDVPHYLLIHILNMDGLIVQAISTLSYCLSWGVLLFGFWYIVLSFVYKIFNIRQKNLDDV